jgi:superkiller protein 3
MSRSKAALKAVKAALDSQKYEDAAAQAKKLLETDPENYHA